MRSRGHHGEAAVLARWGAWWAGHPRLLRVLALLGLAWSLTYIVWRVGWSLAGSSLPLWSCLLAAEAFGTWNLAMLSWLSWDVRPRSRPPARAGHSVDVYVCTYDEPASVLEATLSGCALLSYPHTTWLLDDGGRAEVAELARRWGVRYLARPDRQHAKAGNINHALTRTQGEYVLVLDADHVPMPDALDLLVGYLEDPKVALVQTPHDFSNHDSVQHYALGRHEQSVFFSTICAGKDRHNAAFWCGSGALIRREALLSIGGVATETIAEDFHTTIKLHRRGWRTRYDERIVAQGLAPHDLASYLLQRDRWARGNLAVFTTPESPLRAGELRFAQRMSYLASLTGYLAGPVRLLLLAVLAAVLWTGALPLHVSLVALAALWAPAMLLSRLAGSALCRGAQSAGESSHYELCTAEIFTRALRCVVRPGRTTFKVTPKEGTDRGGWAAVRQFRLLIACAILLSVGMALRVADDLGAGVLPAMHGFAAWFVPALAVFELGRVARTLARVAQHRQLRVEYRTPLRAAAVIVPAPRPGAGERSALVGRMHDITTTGVGFELSTALAVGERADLTLQLPGAGGEPDSMRLQVEVRSCLRHEHSWRIGASILSCSEQDRRLLLSYCYVIWPYTRLRGEAGALLSSQPPGERGLAPHAPLQAEPAAG
jgi:cellulose synthase (UDP-forming)